MAAKLEKTRHPGIYRRGGRYVVRYTDADGHARQESARTLDEARTLKASRMAAVASGEHQVASKVKFREYADEWVERYQGRGSRGFRESTRDDYRRDLRRYIYPYFDGKVRRTVEQIDPRDVANFVAYLCDQPTDLADATIRRILSPLRACMSSALSEGLIRQNPTVGVSLPVRDEQRAIDEGRDLDPELVKALSEDELATFLFECPLEWRLFFDTLATTGMRVSEIFALRWRDLDLESKEPEAMVRRAYVRGRFGPPKSKYGRRNIPIHKDLAAQLIELRKTTEWMGDNELVFPAKNGEPLRQENVRRRVLKPAAKRAGVPWVGFHTFRHTCATRLFDDGKQPTQVQRWLGHHSAAFTLTVYVHLMNEDLGSALEPVKGVTRVSREGTDMARNDTQSVAKIPH